jgi:CxxC motif-containing protein
MNLICIKCPRGCLLTINNEEITGNMCPRGIDYAKEELTRPMRIVTALVKVGDNLIAPVKTNKEVPKDKIFDVLNLIKTIHVEDAKIGDVLQSNVLGLDVDLVVTGNPYVS